MKTYDSFVAILPQRSRVEKHEPSRLITQPVSPSRYLPARFQIDAAEHVPKSPDKMRNRRPFRYTAAAESLTVQPPSLPPLSRSAHLATAVQKGSTSAGCQAFDNRSQKSRFCLFSQSCDFERFAPPCTLATAEQPHPSCVDILHLAVFIRGCPVSDKSYRFNAVQFEQTDLTERDCCY